MSRLNRPENFIGRVDYAAKIIAGRRPTSRAFDNCFENNDGDEVLGVLLNRAKRNPQIARNIGFYINAENIDDARKKYDDMPTREIAVQAAAARQHMHEASLQRRREYLAEMEREEAVKNWHSGARPKPWRQSVQKYVGKGRVLSESEYARWERNAIKDAADLVALANLERFERTAHPLLPDLQILLCKRNSSWQASMLLMDANGEILGGMVRGLPYVKPEHRGNGFGSEIIWITEKLFPNRYPWNPGNYSEEGFRARLGAHRLHVERQGLEDSRSVAPWVSAQYGIEDGRARLTQPWTISEQNGAYERAGLSASRQMREKADTPDNSLGRLPGM